MQSSNVRLKKFCFNAVSYVVLYFVMFNFGCGGRTLLPNSSSPAITFQAVETVTLPPPANPTPTTIPVPIQPLVPVLKSVKSFGATGDGIQDDSFAFAAAIKKQRCFIVPEGTYLFKNNVEVESGSVCLVGEGMGKSVLRGKAAPIPSSSTERRVSWNMFKLSNFMQISFSDLTIDGQIGNGEVGYVHDGSYIDQQAPIEIYKSSHIVFKNVEFTRYKPSIPTPEAGGVVNPEVSLRYKTGALFIHESQDIRILNSKNTYPIWQEGHAILDSQDIYIDGFQSDCGEYKITGNEISSVFQIFGASTSKVTIKNSRLRCFLGSAIVLNGSGDFKITNNSISGIQENGVSVGEGLNLGEESGSQIYPHYSTVLDGLEIKKNQIKSTATYAVNFATSEPLGVIRYRNINLERNEIIDGFVGIMGSSSEDVKIQSNSLRKILRYKGESNFGSSIVLGNSNRVLIKQNKIDGSHTSAYDKEKILSLERHAGVVTVETVLPHAFVPTQPVVLSGFEDKSFNGVYPNVQVLGPNRVSFLQKGGEATCVAPCKGTIATYAESIIGIFTYDSDNVEVKWNTINGPRVTDYMHASSRDGVDQNISFVSNTLEGTPQIAIQIGTKQHQVKSASVYGNSLNGSSKLSKSVHSRQLLE